MSHRARSRTVDSADGKKPRRLQEKIAIMKKREHEQSEAFEHAMKSIHEMQQASRIHSGGGSMPSLQAIDSAPPPHTMDMQVVRQEYTEMSHGPATASRTYALKDRPQSGGPDGRRPVMSKAISMDTEPYPNPGHGDHYWNVSHSGEWMEGDLSRHKSDSDLQQSLLLQQQQQQQQMSHSHGSPHHHHHHHHYPLALGSPQPQPKSHRMSNSPPADIALWRRTNSASTAHALLSPDPCLTNHHDAPLSSPLGASAASTGTASSSLPDLTNIEFSCGLDVPLERDEPHTHSPAMMGNGQGNVSLQMQQQQQQQQQQQMAGNSFYSPPLAGPGPSKLLYTSLSPLTRPAVGNNVPSNVQVPSLSPRYTSGFQFPLVQGNISSTSKQPVQGTRQVSPLAAFQSSQSQITKSPTMPDFRSLRSNPTQFPFVSHEYPTTPRLKPILPNGPPGAALSRSHALIAARGGVGGGGGGGGGGGSGGGVGFDSTSMMMANHHSNPQDSRYPGQTPVTFVIQSPRGADQLVNSMARESNERQVCNSQQRNLPPPLPMLQQQHHPNSIHPSPSSPVISSPMLSSPSAPAAAASSQFSPSPPKPMTATFSNHTTDAIGPLSNPGGSEGGGGRTGGGSEEVGPAGNGGGVFPVINGVASLPNTPTVAMGPGLLGLSCMLPSYIEARQQQALQEKFASINVGKTESMIRSHSEENLQKVQKDRGELIQQNPFMGTLTNANSVPCVYVESQNVDSLQDGPESPPTIDSPSTSASYASSPPSVRPFWMDLNDYGFNEWPMEAGTGGMVGGMASGSGPGASSLMQRLNSPPHHHRSLTDLIQNTIPALSELSSSSKNKAQQLSLPSVAMTDLTVEEHLDRPPESPSEFLTNDMTDFDMEDSVMELIKNDVSDMNSFDVNMLGSDAGVLTHNNTFFSSDSYFHSN